QPPTKRTMFDAPLWPLPDAVVSRPKTGLTVPVREWLLARTGDEGISNNRGLRAWSKVVYAYLTRCELPTPPPQRGEAAEPQSRPELSWVDEPVLPGRR